MGKYGKVSVHPIRDGVQCECEECRASRHAYYAAYAAANRERRAELGRKFRARQDEDYDRKRYEMERERRLAYQRRYYREHVDEHIRRNQARRNGVSGSHTKADVEAQFRRQRGRCYWCKTKLKGKRGRHTWHIDHVIPLAAGGSDGPENIVCACPRCNYTKSAQHPMQYAGVMF